MITLGNQHHSVSVNEVLNILEDPKNNLNINLRVFTSPTGRSILASCSRVFVPYGRVPADHIGWSWMRRTSSAATRMGAPA